MTTDSKIDAMADAFCATVHDSGSGAGNDWIADFAKSAYKAGYLAALAYARPTLSMNGKVMPPGCKCDPGDWGDVRPICPRYRDDGDSTLGCVECEHDEVCHSRAEESHAD